MYRFLEACHAGRLAVAAQYLDLRELSRQQRLSEGPEFARELCDLLDRDPGFELVHLSNSPEGTAADGLAPNLDTLATFDRAGRSSTLQLERIDQNGREIWLVSPSSVALIPELYAGLQAPAIERKLPAPLVNVQFVDTPIWIWLALLLIALAVSLLSRLISKLIILIASPIAKRYIKNFHTQRLQALVEPLRVLVAVVVFRVCMQFVPPSALLRDYILKMLILLFVLGCAALVMRVVDVVSDQILSRLDPRERALSYSVFPLLVRSIKIVVFCLAVIWVFSAWGYNTNAILAGVGVGGLAVALAAQKTIENLFGGVALISDRPVLVGDFCAFGGQVGTVEDIGLRSTRIRTLDRTLVTIPNATFSTMTLENYSKRDRIWFHPTLQLKRNTNPALIRSMMDAMAQILQQHPLIDASGVPLRFTKINDQSFQLEVFAYVLTADYNEFLKIQTELLIQFLEAAHKLGVEFAVPIAESVSISPAHDASPDSSRASIALPNEPVVVK
jgi:MscS family membrane protein